MVTIKQLTLALHKLMEQTTGGEQARAYANQTIAESIEGVEVVPCVRVRLTGITEHFHPVHATKAVCHATQGWIDLTKAFELRRQAQEGEGTGYFAVQVNELNNLMEHFTLQISP